jgi:hypothetical protein
MMNTRMRTIIANVVVFALLASIGTICGCSSGIETALQDIPRYPGATEGESMANSLPGGFLGGASEQFTTTDPFEEVVDFYTDALIQYDTEFMNHESELGRQTAISIPQKKGVITVAIQEFTDEGTVNITFMAVGG